MDKILIIDDQIGILDMLTRRLTKKNYDVYATNKVEETEQLIKDNQIDLVLLDYMMPQLTGYELFIRIHQQFEIPVIMMTAHSSIQLAVEFIKSGGIDFIEKPIDIDILDLRIKRAIKNYRILIEEVNARRKAEEELKKTNQILEFKNKVLEFKNKELDAFTAIVSHDLKAPANNIKNFVQLLKGNLPESDEESHQLFSFIEEGTYKINNIINELLQLTKIGKSNEEHQLIDTSALIKKVIKNQNISDHLKVEIGTLPNINGKPTLIEQVFVNLIENAIKYSSKEEYPIIRITAQEDDKVFEFCIEDNGVGFNQEYAHQLFRLFKRLHSDSEFEGTGIGLANVKKIIDYHHGKVWAKSQEGKGASFFFTIPKYTVT